MAMSDEESFQPTPEELAPWTVKRKYVPVLRVPSEPWHVNALWEDGYFQAARLVVGMVADHRNYKPEHTPMPQVEGVAGVYLFRHYLELALKYLLFHSRWLRNASSNAHWTEVQNVAKTHSLRRLWDTVKAERVGKLSDELWNNFDVEFVEECIQDFDAADSNGEKFRYPGPTIGFSLGEPATDRLYVWFEAFDKQMKHVRDVLLALDTYLVEMHGMNAEWEAELNSF